LNLWVIISQPWFSYRGRWGNFNYAFARPYLAHTD
jgi:hypothetical protein